jgi:hypothetical protein
LRDRYGGDGEGLDGEGLHAGAGWLLRLRLIATCGSGYEQGQREEWEDGVGFHSDLHDRDLEQGSTETEYV